MFNNIFKYGWSEIRQNKIIYFDVVLLEHVGNLPKGTKLNEAWLHPEMNEINFVDEEYSLYSYQFKVQICEESCE